MTSPFRTPTELYTTANEDANLRALILASKAGSVASNVTLYNSLQAAGLSRADAARAANPSNTPKLVTYNVVFTGTASKTDVSDALIAYTNALALGADVIAATAATAVTDLATVTSAQTFELSLDADPTGETGDLTIAAGEIAYNTAAALTTAQTVYVDVVITGTILEAACEAIIISYIDGLTAGAVVDQSALAALILADPSVTTVDTCAIGFAAGPVAEVDITLSAGNTAVATAASITFTDAG